MQHLLMLLLRSEEQLIDLAYALGYLGYQWPAMSSIFPEAVASLLPVRPMTALVISQDCSIENDLQASTSI